jgi:hypothetical protein
MKFKSILKFLNIIIFLLIIAYKFRKLDNRVKFIFVIKSGRGGILLYQKL